MASGIASLLRFGGVSLKPIAGCRHQIWNAGQVPVGVRDPGMSDIGRERDHRMVDICAVSLPELDPFANKRMLPGRYGPSDRASVLGHPPPVPRSERASGQIDYQDEHVEQDADTCIAAGVH